MLVVILIHGRKIETQQRLAACVVAGVRVCIFPFRNESNRKSQKRLTIAMCYL